MAGVLYIVATPIGNLDDISLRAIEILKSVEVIAAEDTRHSKRLLNHLGISTRLTSCHQHNESERSPELLELLDQGQDVALISDAGTPLISDPGYQLVAQAQQIGYRVSPVPGASSIIAALSVAGIPTDRFHYYGFLSQKNAERLNQLGELKHIKATILLLESSHRIERLLQQLEQIFPLNRIVVAKELTKIYERIMTGTASELSAIFDADEGLKKGEFVVLIDNPVDPAEQQLDSEEIEMIKILVEELSLKMAVKIAVRLTGKKKNQIYQLALQVQQ